ncbi:hypothetical protein ACWF62_08870 [Rhodococcus sp. NPDC054953]
MTPTLQDKRIAFLVAAEGVEQVELTAPWTWSAPLSPRADRWR